MHRIIFHALAATWFVQDVPQQPAADEQPFEVDNPEAAQQAIPNYIICLQRHAPRAANDAPTFKQFERAMNRACARRNVWDAFVLTSRNIVSGTTAFAARSRKIDAALDARIGAQGLPPTRVWYEGVRAKLRFPRFRPGNAEACTKRALQPGQGNYAAVEAAMTTKQPATSLFDNKAEIAAEDLQRHNRALAGIDKEAGHPVVYRRFPVKLDSATGSMYSTYDPEIGRLSVIVESKASVNSDRDYASGGTLDVGITTLRGGSYIGQNAFGTSAKVVDYTSIMHIWQLGWGSEAAVAYVAGIDIDLSPTEMRRRAANLKIIILGELQPPYANRANVRYRFPTLSNPTNEAIDVLRVFAPVRCAAVYDSATKTILASGTFSDDPS